MVPLGAEGRPVVEVARITRRSPTRCRGCSSATWPADPTPCRTGPIWASRPTTRPPGRPFWPGSPTWTPRGRGRQRAAPRRVRVQAAPLGPSTQGPGPAEVGKQRLRAEGTAGSRRSSAASARMRAGPRCHPGRPRRAAPRGLPRLLGLLARHELPGSIEPASLAVGRRPSCATGRTAARRHASGSARECDAASALERGHEGAPEDNQ
jgi:hypothetical protein